MAGLSPGEREIAVGLAMLRLWPVDVRAGDAIPPVDMQPGLRPSPLDGRANITYTATTG
jgi:hypothetical protein